MCEKTLRPGFGCTNIGAIALRTLTGPIRFESAREGARRCAFATTIGETSSVSSDFRDATEGVPPTLFGTTALSLNVADCLRCRFPQFKLAAHFLQASSKRFDLTLLVREFELKVLFQLRDSHLLLFDLAMLLEKLVQQHRVHRFVAHRIRLPVAVAGHGIGVYFFDFLGHKAKLSDAFGIKRFLVAKGNGFECEDRFARLSHRLDLVFEMLRRDYRDKITIGSYATPTPSGAVDPKMPAIYVAV